LKEFDQPDSGCGRSHDGVHCNNHLRCFAFHYRNAIRALGYEIVDISTAEEIAEAKVIVFPGVGIFGQAMEVSKQML
jgi:hypothetical protein